MTALHYRVLQWAVVFAQLALLVHLMGRYEDWWRDYLGYGQWILFGLLIVMGGHAGRRYRELTSDAE